MKPVAMGHGTCRTPPSLARINPVVKTKARPTTNANPLILGKVKLHSSAREAAIMRTFYSLKDTKQGMRGQTAISAGQLGKTTFQRCPTKTTIINLSTGLQSLERIAAGRPRRTLKMTSSKLRTELRIHPSCLHLDSMLSLGPIVLSTIISTLRINNLELVQS